MKNNNKKLPKLVTNQQPQYGQFSQVDDVNYLDAQITEPNGKPLNRLLKSLKANQFCFVNISHTRYIIGCAVVNLKTVASGFVYIYDTVSNVMLDIQRLNPIALATKLPTTPNKGKISFKQKGLSICLDFTTNNISLNIKSDLINVSADITPSKSPFCLCTRTGYTGWVYMQKQAALTCTGSLKFSKKQKKLFHKTDSLLEDAIFTQANTRAGLDWTLGYMARETFWNWSSINTLLPPTSSNKERSLGLNLSCGVNDTSFTENAVWVDGLLYNLPLTVFDYDKNDLMQPWHIHSNQQLRTDIHVNLTFTPKSVHSDHTDIIALASHFSQIVGIYNGTIVLPNEIINIKDVWGLAEDHYAKW